MATPKLRFKEFDGDWSASNLEQTTQYFKGFAFKSESYKEDGVRIIRVSDLDKDSIKYQNEAIFLDENEAKNYLNWEVKKKDIIVTTVGSKPHLIDSAVGRPIFVKNDNEGLLNQNLLVLRPKNENIDTYFIFSQLLDKKYLTHIETIQRGNANQSNITVKDLQEFEVFQTSKEEQTKIASFLSAVDEKITQLTQKLHLLNQYKQGIMQKLFSQQIRFKADDGSEFGKWENTPLNQIAERVTRKNKEDNQNALTISAQKGLVNQQEFFSKQIASRDLSKYYLLHKGEYAYNKSYSAGYPMGAIKRLKLYDKGVVSTLYICFSLKSSVNSDFFEQYVESGLLVPELEKIAQEGARNHGLLNISLQEFFEVNLILPCLEEQTKIANFLSAMDQKIDGVSGQLEKAKLWKKGLLQQMFV